VTGIFRGGFCVTDEWYFARDTERRGPFSALQLIELATSGEIRPTDMVWKAGVEKRVAAGTISRLFPSVEAEAVPEVAGEAEASAEVSERVSDTPVPSESNPPAIEMKKPELAKQPARKGRATALRGAVIVGQDGQSVQFRKKCTKCGHEDASKSRMPIRQGITRSGFFCPKCRRLMPVELQGIL
jgi:hypothetical protein